MPPNIQRGLSMESPHQVNSYEYPQDIHWWKSNYSKTCVREPPSRLTLNSVWCGKSCLSYKGTCHVILLAKLHDMYHYKTTIFPDQPLRPISKVAVLHRFYCKKLPSEALSEHMDGVNVLQFQIIYSIITKTRLFNYIENFTTKIGKFSNKKSWYFS